METIIRGPDCSLGPVPDTQKSSLGLVPVSIIVVWDWSQGYIFDVWDQSMGPWYLVPDIKNVYLGLVPVSIIDVWDWTQGYIFYVWDQIP